MRLLFATSICLAMALPALAQQPPCGPAKDIEAMLLKNNNEIQIGGGIISEKQVLSIFASPEGDTWTAVILNSDGTACMVAGGEGWFPGTLPVGGDPA